MQWVVEPTALDWVRERLAPFAAAQVTSLVPAGYEAYARILHPLPGLERDHRWSDVAAWSGACLGPSSSFEDIATRREPGGQGERWPGNPRNANLDTEQLRTLIEILGPATAADERCWFAVWEGYGWVWGGVAVISTDPAVHGARARPEELPVPAHVRDGPRACGPSRCYVLYAGGLDDAFALVGDPEFEWQHGLELPWVRDEMPDLWWPASRSWFVGCDTDLVSSYVGASRETIEQLLADPRLETVPVAPGDRLA